MQDGGGNAPKRRRFRVPRSCDRCRRSKVKCIFETEQCVACLQAGLECTFANPGSLAERPPTLKDIEHLNAQVRSLERLLVAAEPEIDLETSLRNGKLAKLTGYAREAMHAALESEDSSPDAGAPAESEDPPSPLRHWSAEDDDELEEAFSSIMLGDEDRYFGEQSLLGTSDKLSAAMKDLDLSTAVDRPEVDKIMEQSLFRSRQRISEDSWPEPDLARSLIELFFLNPHPMMPIFHPGQFLELYERGFARQSHTFRALCFAVFALASRFTNDERVRADDDGVIHENRQLAGYRFARVSILLSLNFLLPADLYELQAWSLVTRWMIGSSSPMLAWSFNGLALHRAQDVAAHRERSKRWTGDKMTNHLRKKVFYDLFFRDLKLSNGLGRGPMMSRSDFDVSPWDPAFDEACGMYDSPYAAQSIFTPKLAATEMRLMMEMTFQRDGLGLALFSTFLDFSHSIAKDRPRQFLSTADKLAVDLEEGMRTWIEALPEELRYRPDIEEDGRLVQAVHLTSVAKYCELLVHRRMHAFDSRNETALRRCAEAAKELMEMSAVLRQRGLLAHTFEWIPFVATSSGIILLYESEKLPQLTGPAFLDRVRLINSALSTLWTLAPTSYICQRAHRSLTKLMAWHGRRFHKLRQEGKLPIPPGTEGQVVVMCGQLAEAFSEEEKSLQSKPPASKDPASQTAPTSKALPALWGTYASSPPTTASAPAVEPMNGVAPTQNGFSDEAGSFFSQFNQFNPVAFDVSSLLGPNEVWGAAPTGGRADEPFAAHWAGAPATSQTEPMANLMFDPTSQQGSVPLQSNAPMSTAPPASASGFPTEPSAAPMNGLDFGTGWSSSQAESWQTLVEMLAGGPPPPTATWQQDFSLGFPPPSAPAPTSMNGQAPSEPVRQTSGFSDLLRETAQRNVSSDGWGNLL